MPWKKDLAKLKQDLGKEETPPARIAPPKVKPAHPVSQSIEEEDNIFLSAMGMRPKRAAGPQAAAAPPRDAPAGAVQPQAEASPAGKGEFSSAMGDLKGLKPIKGASVQEKPARAAALVPAQAAEPAPLPPMAPSPAEPATELAPMPEPAPGPLATAPPPAPAQTQIHLAAGMAIVVDGSLDLKGHARSDAEERLKERILDGYALGWRTLHVVVGPSEELRLMVLDLLKSPAGKCVARYAQAPVPMGGVQAWILYFRGPGSHEN